MGLVYSRTGGREGDGRNSTFVQRILEGSLSTRSTDTRV